MVRFFYKIIYKNITIFNLLIQVLFTMVDKILN